MKILIDTDARTLTTVDGGAEHTAGLYTRAAFETISREWVRIGWSLRYYHNFSWFGLPILQLPEDLVRVQEVIFRLRPDVIVETGVFRGGSLVYYASLCQALGKGRVIGIDLQIAAADRERIRTHMLGSRISLIEGDSVSPAVVEQVGASIRPGESVLVLLDSCHTREHVAGELECYSRFVTPGSYIVAADGVMRDLAAVPGGEPGWVSDNPLEAAKDFAARHPEFLQEQPPWLFHDGELTENVTYWPGAWLRRT
ncbi:MAG: cephalosporin hydroxylase family protein [Acidobacteriota bacterium]